MKSYKRPKELQNIIDSFWGNSGYPKFKTQNWDIVDSAIEYAYRKIKED